MKKIDSIDFVLRFALIFYILMFIGLVGCSADEDLIILEEPRLEIDGRLPLDNNGYYHLELRQESWQTIHTISGTVSNWEYYEPLKVEWNANLTWNLQNVIEWEIATSNQVSYVVDGKVMNVIAPVKTMVGDTLILTGIIREHLTTDIIKIVLE